uniref:Remodeling and spacing factor 1 n=1 Tax=Echinostoma caproni TaxID=27848 RepID=A0A183BGP5_9TREM
LGLVTEMTSQCTDKVYSDDNDTTDDKTVPDLQDPELPPAKGNSSDQAVVEQESHTADKTITSAYKNVDTESVSCQLTDESKSQENSLTEDPVTEKRSSDDGFQMGISQCNVELNTNEAFAVNSDPEDSPAVVAVCSEKHPLAENSTDPCIAGEY